MVVAQFPAYNPKIEVYAVINNIYKIATNVFDPNKDTINRSTKYTPIHTHTRSPRLAKSAAAIGISLDQPAKVAIAP